MMQTALPQQTLSSSLVQVHCTWPSGSWCAGCGLCPSYPRRATSSPAAAALRLSCPQAHGQTSKPGRPPMASPMVVWRWQTARVDEDGREEGAQGMELKEEQQEEEEEEEEEEEQGMRQEKGYAGELQEASLGNVDMADGSKGQKERSCWMFAYGANMSMTVLRRRGVRPSRSVPATLPGFCLVFNHRGGKYQLPIC
ncbi:hypothetical protein CBR_g4000 [Chara braunii]|uniref:Uncharacterized protein n=1 Tax=Chara braunii TaxID=69332 RepID=A0A388KGY8_CHABU|nr:hypothetical protein CBR_g4000 [Chara braunii]|eukprot:GBG69301.1 hypothetical protein CBR_g4000 [Chara braunii]